MMHHTYVFTENKLCTEFNAEGCAELMQDRQMLVRTQTKASGFIITALITSNSKDKVANTY